MPRLSTALALALASLPVAPSAWAAGGESSGNQLGTIVLLLSFVAAAYLLAHYVVDQLQKRFLFVTGLEFVVLGVLLGPAVPQIHAFDNLASIAPVIALAAGWIGLINGMELDLRRMATTRDKALRLVLVEGLLTGGGVTVATQAFLTSSLVGATSREGWLAGLALGCAAVARSTSAIHLLTARYGTGPTLRYIERAIRYGDALAISLFGVIFCVFHQGQTATEQPMGPSDWLLVTIGLGVALGMLFTTFLGEDDDDNSRFLALVGIITFASGAAFFLQVSLLTVNLVLGVILANTSRSGDAIQTTLAGTIRPITLVLLVFGGALWTPVPLVPAVLMILGYMAVRTLTTVVGSWLASRGHDLRGDLYRGMVPQGNVALAMALSLELVYDSLAVHLVYTTILVSVVVLDFIAPRLLKGLLIDAGDIRAERPAPSAVGGA